MLVLFIVGNFNVHSHLDRAPFFADCNSWWYIEGVSKLKYCITGISVHILSWALSEGGAIMGGTILGFDSSTVKSLLVWRPRRI